MSLLNQLEDGQHHTMELWLPGCDVPEDACKRDTEGERAVDGRGLHEFIPQEDLSYRGDKNCQYLKDDTLFFTVDCFELEPFMPTYVCTVCRLLLMLLVYFLCYSLLDLGCHC